MADLGPPQALGGGFWNSPQVKYSKQTHELLKDLMRESKLTNFQQRHLEKNLKDGNSLPLCCPPTSSVREKSIKQTLQHRKVLNPRVCTGGLRSRETMEKMGAFEKPDYVPPRQHTRSAREKERLANLMAYGEEMPPIPVSKVIQKPEEEKEIDRFKELQNEIEERQEFLREMAALGKEEKYKYMIETEISQKLREMEILDRKRNAELEMMIKKQQQQQKLRDAGYKEQQRRQDSEYLEKLEKDHSWHIPKPEL